MKPIPQLDLSRAAARIRADLDARWGAIVDGTGFIGGQEVTGFEEELRSFLETDAVVGVANGTDALVLALRALGVGPGDEVLVPAFTFVATAATVSWLGATPVFVDVEPATLNLDPAALDAAVTPRTVGVITVHLYGCPCDLDRVGEVVRERGLWLIEDAAQAHGARWRGRRVGSFGSLATWSFYPTKNLGGFGDGGAVSGDADLVHRVRLLANHGSTERYRHAEIGVNSRLDALQAAVLRCRLAHLEADNERRRQLARRYEAGLRGAPGLLLLEAPAAAEPVWHQYTVLLEERDRVRDQLSERGIGTAVHYPTALHRQPVYSARAVTLPVSERAAERVLCLPMFAELTDDEVDRVVAAVRDLLS